LLAHHYTEAGLTAQAVYYYHTAAQRAVERSAHVEAIRHLTKGLELLETLSETPQRLQHEVDLHIALGASLLTTKGYGAAEVGETYTYARQRCQPLEDPQRLFPVLRGLWNYSYTRAEYQTARALGEQLLTLAQQSQDSAMLLAAHRALGATWLMRGAGAAAHTHFAQGLALYDPQQHRVSAFRYGEDAGVVCASHDAWTLWHLGYPDQGLTRNHEAVTLARQRAYPLGLSFALNFAAMFHQFRREAQTAQEYTDASLSVATEQGFPFWEARGALLRGWALVHQGQAQAGIAQMHQGMSALRANGAELGRPYWLALLAAAHGTRGEPEAGLAVLTEALTLMDTTGERVWEPELYRLKGELLLQQRADHQAEAEHRFQQALVVAQHQQAKSWE